VSVLLHSQLKELLSPSVEQLQLVSLLVEDVNECQAGVGLCGEEAECFNGVGTYLCRCRKGYEDHSPTKAGTLCVRTPRAGLSTFLRHADMLVGAALVAALVMLVAFGVLCVTVVCGWAPSRASPRPEEEPAVSPSAVRAAEEPAMELHRLGECLQLDPFQLKLRARSPEWLWSVRAHPGQAGQVCPEQLPQP
ncbi:AGRE2 protein, partial [Sylvia atricapilla]|nr:AGRE2 protein [Sylvia atricapilla]